MKKLKQILVTILVMTSIMSCEKEESNQQVTLKQETISGKWIVDGATEFKSFEFNKNGNYILVKNSTTKTGKLTNMMGDETILFGTYKILDSDTILLSGFGTIKITNINQDTMDYTITLEGSDKKIFNISVTKAKEMVSSIKTELLCRTWKMVEENGHRLVDAEGIQIFLFSKAGTYFTSYDTPLGEPDTELVKWKWKDETETKLLYSWKETPEWNIDNDDEGEAEIIELTNNMLKVHEKNDNNEEFTYILEPYLAAKTTRFKSSGNKSNTIAKRGFLGR
jgi:hypothetical protein